MSKFKTYVKSILIPVILGGIVGFITSSSIDYNSLQKPFLSPPRLDFSCCLVNTVCINGNFLWNFKIKFSSKF